MLRSSREPEERCKQKCQRAVSAERNICTSVNIDVENTDVVGVGETDVVGVAETDAAITASNTWRGGQRA